jgi:hypothetical protein
MLEKAFDAVKRHNVFKAKTRERYDKQQWVEGFLFKSIDKEPYILEHFSGTMGLGKYHRVDGSTLCQYTNRDDKNNKHIWENDILHSEEKDKILVVRWDKASCQLLHA